MVQHPKVTQPLNEAQPLEEKQALHEAKISKEISKEISTNYLFTNELWIIIK